MDESNVLVVISEMSQDLKWIKRMGGWWMTLTGSALLLLIPTGIAFAIYVSGLERRISLVEQQLTVVQHPTK